MALSLNNFVENKPILPEVLATYSIGSVALFSHETPTFITSYKAYKEADSVAVDFGTSSITYAMADKIFNQNNSIRNIPDYRLVIVPTASTTGTAGSFLTTDLVVANFQEVNDGAITITINQDTPLDLTDLDFSEVLNVNDIASVFGKKLGIKVSLIVDDNTIKFESKDIGTNSSITFSAYTASGTNISVSGLLDISSGTAVTGVDDAGETISQAITRLNNTVSFNAFTTTRDLTNDSIVNIAITANTQKKMFFYSLPNKEDSTDLKTRIFDAGYQYYTRLVFGAIDIQNARLLRAVLMTQAYSSNIVIAGNTLFSPHGKSAKGVIIEDLLSQSDFNDLNSTGFDTYAVFEKGFGNAFYLSATYTQLTFAVNTQIIQDYLQVVIADKFKTNTLTKSIASIGSIRQLISSTLDIFRVNEVITLASEDNDGASFGDATDSQRDLADKGYYIFIPPLNTFSEVMPYYIAVQMNSIMYKITNTFQFLK